LIDTNPLTSAALAAKVQRCCIAPDQFEIGYEDYLQSVEIRVFGASLADEQIEDLLVIQKDPPFPIVTFVSHDVLQRSSAILRERNRKKSRDWFHQRGLLDKLPVFKIGNEEPIEFARRLEKFCGIAPGAVFEVNDTLKVIMPKAEWVAQPLRKGWLWRKFQGSRHQEQFECLMAVMSLVDAELHGIRFGFIGNEYFADG
jgi:hypothetical protein